MEAWGAAEAQALEACAELHDFDRSITASGYYEIGEIRRRRGDFAGAEDAYRTATKLGGRNEPGLSLLRLAQGKVDAAVAGLSHSLRDLTEPLHRMRRLPAQVEVTVAAGDLAAARAAADDSSRSWTRSRSASVGQPLSTRRRITRAARSRLRRRTGTAP